MVADAERAGITDIFLQIRGRGGAWYRSDLVPLAPQLAEAWDRHTAYDPLRVALEEAHPRGIRVHAWMNAYLVWSSGTPPEGHVIRTHPQWIAVDARGESMLDMGRERMEAELTEGVYLDPGNPEVVRHLLRVVEEVIARYPVDGIHLDYIRYPEMDVGYGEAMRAAFRAGHGVDPVELSGNERGLRRERGDHGYETLALAWRAQKMAQVTALVEGVAALRNRTRPEMILSAAVKPDVGSARRVAQDWLTWIQQDHVDVVAPMMYSADQAVVRRQAVGMARLVPHHRIWAGVAVYNKSLRDAERNIASIREAGIPGISIFSYNSLPGGGESLVRLSRPSGGR